MTAIIISGHGQLSTGLLDAFHMVFGEDQKIVAVPFLNGEGIPQLQAKFKAQLAKFSPDEEVLFMVDVFGGTPYNSATQLIFGQDKMDVVTGVNLPMLLEVAGVKDSVPLSELTSMLKVINQESFNIFSEQIKAIRTEDLEEDDLL